MKSMSWILLVPVLVLFALIRAPTSLANCIGKTLIRTGLSCQEKKIILDEHNKLRQLVALGQIRKQPPAKYMMELVWDDELALVAQGWASGCNEYHDNQRHVRRFNVGQNIARSWTRLQSSFDSLPAWRKIIVKWFDEAAYYRYFGELSTSTAHYTQIVWANTKYIGCGYSYYYDPRRGNIKNYVCNYGPRGNVLTFKPYPSGTPNCNAYGLNFSNRYQGLCAPVQTGYPLGAYCPLL